MTLAVNTSTLALVLTVAAAAVLDVMGEITSSKTPFSNACLASGIA